MSIQLHHSRISIPEKNRRELVTILNITLASLTDLQVQLKQAHWNIKGLQFIALHKLFDDLSEEVAEHVDTVAERITSLGGTALGTLQEAVANTELRIYPTNIFSATDHLEHLTHNFAILGELSRTNIILTEKLDDMATNDIYINITRMLDKNLWFLEAHIQK